MRHCLASNFKLALRVVRGYLGSQLDFKVHMAPRFRLGLSNPQVLQLLKHATVDAVADVLKYVFTGRKFRG